jgi:hypothetical protein
MFLLAILAKPSALVLPLVLLLFDYFVNGRVTWGDLRGKAPLFCIALGCLVFAGLSAREHLAADPSLTFFDHLLIASYALIFYLSKSMLPLRLSCLYPYPLKTGGLLPPAFLFSPLLVACIAAAVALSGRYTRAVIFGALFFLITIFPSLRIFPPGLMIVADRYTYLPSIGPAFVAAAALLSLFRRGGWIALAAVSISVAIAALLCAMTWQRCAVWNNSFALWDAAVRAYPDSHIPIAYFNRGITHFDMDRHEEAVADFTRALELYRRELGFTGDGAEPCARLLRAGRGYPKVYHCIATRFAEIGKMQEATACLNISRQPRGQGAFSPQESPAVSSAGPRWVVP